MPVPSTSARFAVRWVWPLLLVFMLSGQVASGQSPRWMREQSWLTGDGLPQDSVHQVLQTSDGFLWLATEGGLARFDGVHFRVFDRRSEPAMLSDDLCCLAEGGDGTLWVGSTDGLLRLTNAGVERIGREQGMTSTTVRGLAAAAGDSMLVLTADGLGEVRDGRFNSVAGAPANIDVMVHGRKGVWLIGGGKAMLWKGGRVTATVEASPDSGALTGVAEGPDGGVWVSTNSSVETVAAGVRQSWKVGGMLPGTRVASVFVDRKERAWVGTNDGVIVLTGDGRARRVPALGDNTILETMEDREGNFWFGGESSGLHVLRELKFHGEPALAGVGVTAVAQASDGAVWVGTRRDGVRRVTPGNDGEAARTTVVTAALTSPVILTLAPGLAGAMWVGTPDGLNEVSAAGAVRQITSADGLPDDYIQALAAGQDGSQWVGTRHGLAHVTGAQVTVLSQQEGLPGDLVGALLAAHDGTLWIATPGGLTQRGRDGSLKNFGMRAGVVTTLAEAAAGVLWLGGQEGALTRFAGGDFRPLRVPSLSAGGAVLGMVALPDGWLWVRQDRGVARVRLAELNACAPQPQVCGASVQSFGMGDGIASLETVAAGSPALFRMTDGELWFATRRGVAIADALHLPENTVAPPVVIERVLRDDVPVTPVDGRLTLPYGGSRLTIEYAGLSFTAPAEVRYRFQLEGFDRQWTEAGSRRSASYTNLPPGTYRFRVQAANNDGVWNEAGAGVGLRIVPPYYRQWWFLLGVTTGLALLGFAIYRARLRRLQAGFDVRLQERNRIAREIHDTLAQDFVGVTVQLDLVTQMLRREKIDAALEQVRQTRTLVTDGLAEARRSIWQLRANTTEDDLPARLRAVTERYGGSATVRLTLGGAYRKLPAAVEDEVLRIAQEALSNVHRHAAADEAWVALAYEGAMLVLTVEDDGRGFAPSASLAGGHYGVQGMRERAAVLGAELAIENRLGGGTRVRLALKIAAAQ